MKKSFKGFTLIELLIVIAIIGILASVVLVSLSGARDKAKIAAFKAQVHSLQAAAVLQCDSLATNGVTELKNATQTGILSLTYPGSGGTLGAPSGTVEASSCGSAGAGTFTLNVQTSTVATCNHATIKDTGATFRSGC